MKIQNLLAKSLNFKKRKWYLAKLLSTIILYQTFIVELASIAAYTDHGWDLATPLA